MGFVNNHSPLRYPGGKAVLADFLIDVLKHNDLYGKCIYSEPFAGGAGAAITLLKKGVVSKIYINDYDYRITAFWNSILKNTDEFIEKICDTPITIGEWANQRCIYDEASRINYSMFDVGFATFYLNRCNRSGILPKAGPIGGRSQNGKYKINSRFKKNVLIDRIKSISKLKDRIKVYNLEAMDFIEKQIIKDKGNETFFVYLDPPYYSKSQDLYYNSLSADDHEELSRYIISKTKLKWIMSYDSVSEIKDLYSTQQLYPLSIVYSAQKFRKENELLIVPNQTILPPDFLDEI